MPVPSAVNCALVAYTYALGIAWRFDSSHEDLYQDMVLIYQTREIQPPVSLTKHSEITDSILAILRCI